MDVPVSNVSYKQLHEEFMSGLNGSSLVEVSVLTLIPVGSTLVRDLFCLFVNDFTQPWLIVLNVMIIIVPMLLSFTVLNFTDFTVLVSLFTTAAGMLGLIAARHSQSKRTQQSKSGSLLETFLDLEMSSRRPFISYFRGQTLLATAVAILAVDFTIFPRRFAKTETYGTGLMDTGVGLFVVVNAVVSPEARGKVTTKSPVLAVMQAVKSSMPLVVIGALRLLAVKNIDYQEHVSEYGVHWNFFLTLAAVKVLSAVILSVFPVHLSGLLSIVIAAGYQYSLTATSLPHYILHGADGRGRREGFLDANREGLFSCIGYLAIYFAGVEIGSYIFRKRRRVRDWMLVLCVFVSMSLLSWIVLGIVSNTVEPVSRRLANGPFCIWTVALSFLLLTVNLAGDIAVTCAQSLCPRDGHENKTFPEDLSTTCLLSAINYNSLLYFLVANLLTGLVNMSLQTLYAPPSLAITIITGYMLVLSGLVMLLYRKKISTKFW
ncbi:phosphatidylinositol-glycan biosynthesis class W protein-like [Haliotis rufescens]|uniref:phosphatidylinositol-glycan biosynthesis class W protein-like n=1 Tax=Haliotis rufescens TaxID=6454 RepID=UPI00201F40A4|nr:phosphatidylinositol-glycan biosynthesis class W protein-like [Haliotis rufescens]